MALTIGYDGYGVVANADSLTNDTGGSATGDWRELGGGAYSLSPDASKYAGATPPAAIGSKYASKSGYTYIDGITALDFSSGGTEEGQLIYIWVMMLSPTPLRVIANTPYNIVLGDSTGTLNEYTVASKSDSNGWDGKWRIFAIDPTITPTINGGADLSAIDTIGIWVNTDTSVRAESFYISQIMCAKGLKVEGTSTTFYKDIVDWCEDYSNRAAGMFQSRGQTYFSLGSLSIHSDTANTVVSADGSNIEYEKCEFYNGTSWVTSYPTTANVITMADSGGNTVSVTDTNIGMAGNSSNKVSYVANGATSYSKVGGYLKYLSTMTADGANTFGGVVFSLYDARTLGAEPYNACTFDGSATLTVTGTSDFKNGNTVSGVSNVNSLSVSNLSYIDTTILYSSGSNHGVELTSIGSGTMTWNVKSNNFDTGATGSPITPTSTGNEDIYITATSTSDITINIATGATIPSVRVAASFTGSVNIVAGLVDFKFTVSPSIVDYEYRIYSVTTSGSLVGATELQGLETATADNYTYTYTYSTPDPIAVQIISQPDHDYEEIINYYNLSATDQSVIINLKPDINN